MRIQKKYWFVVILILLFFIGAEVYSYGKALKEIDNASAVTVGVPNPGHSLSQLECNANSLCVDTANGRVGIGTANPTAKLDVNGVLNLNSNKITGVATPTASSDAATKSYVDAAGSGAYSTCYVASSTTCVSGYTAVATSVSGANSFGGICAGLPAVVGAANCVSGVQSGNCVFTLGQSGAIVYFTTTGTDCNITTLSLSLGGSIMSSSTGSNKVACCK
jgi:hypothetical protein